MLRLSFLAPCCLLFLISSAFSQNKLEVINPSDQKFWLDEATKLVEAYGQSLSLIGSPDIGADDRELVIYDIENRYMLSGQVQATFYNDLDPTKQTNPLLRIDKYLKYIRINYPEDEGVELELRSIEAYPAVFLDERLQRLFVKVTADRYLRGTYNNQGKPMATEGTQKLDFYVQVYNTGNQNSDIRIFSMTAHDTNVKRFTQVRVSQSQAKAISDEERERLEERARLAQRELERTRERLKEAEAQVEYEKKLRLAAQAQQAAEEQARKSAEARAAAEARAKKAALAQAEAERKIQRLSSRLAKQNRLHLQLGVGAGYYFSSRYQQIVNGDTTYHLGNYFGSFALGYRLSSLEKITQNRGTNFYLYANVGQMDQFALRGIFSEAPTNYEVALGEDKVFWELEAGFAFWNRLRVSGGIGTVEVDHFVDGAIGQQVVSSTENYYCGTVGWQQPFFGNGLVLGLNLNVLTPELDAMLHPRIEATLRFQIE